MAANNNDSDMEEMGRIWACLVYPDSAPSNWLDILQSKLIPCYVSPLHDKDKVDDELEEKLKKPHWHVLLVFSGSRKRKNILKLVAEFGGVGAELVLHKSAYVAYLTHANSPEKYQYTSEDVQVFNGAVPYDEVIQNSDTVYELVGEMIEWCSVSGNSFADLVDFSRLNRFDWFRILVDRNCALIWQYIKSKTWRNNGKKKPVM